MQVTEHPALEVQKQFWVYWNSTYGHPSDHSRLRPLRRAEKILGYLRSLHLQRPTILDMGCGTGWFANQLAKFGPTTGIDLCDEAIAQAKVNFPEVVFRACNLFEVELPDRYFDVVISQEVLAHVPDQRGYLERAARTLQPGGYLILSTPNRFIHNRSQWDPLPPGHIEHWLSRRMLKGLLRPHFRVIRAQTLVPMGDRGILRLINSYKLNLALRRFLSADRIDALKEWAGFGWTQIVLAQKI